MKVPPHLFAIFLVGCLLTISSVNLLPAALADGSSEKVPAPSISVNHIFDQAETYQGKPQGNFDNEAWTVTITDGDLKIPISARNYTAFNQTFVDYNIYFNFYLEGKFYIAMFTIDQVLIEIENDSLLVPLKNCAGFEVSHTSVVYDGTVPTIDCTVTYRDVRVFPDAPGSAFDLTLVSHFRGDWDRSSIKVDALLDFEDMDLGRYASGTPFAAEIHYIMQLTDPSINLGYPDYNTVKPSSFTDTSLEYDLTRADGSPYSLSQLEMVDDFTIYNHTGAQAATGYSRIDAPSTNGSGMSYNHNARVVTHGFPDLVYNDTLSIRSDPEIVVFHDRNGNAFGLLIYIVPIVVVASILAVAGVFIIRRRKARSN